MARANWGGRDDYSGLFAGLASEMESMQEALINRAIGQSQEDRNAADAETYDKWKNGLITDAAWLAYVRGRVESSKGDPEEHQKWVETLREHTTSIADNQAEFNFENGTISIHGLIAYYRKRMGGIEKNSQAWRTLASRVNVLQDHQASLAGGGGGGGGRGGGGGGGGRGGGGGGGGADDSGFAGSEAALAAGGDPEYPGEDAFASMNSIFGYTSDKEFTDGLFGDLDRIDTFWLAYDANPSMTTYYDKYSNQTIEVTDELIADINAQYMRTTHTIASVKLSNGDRDGSTAAEQAGMRYLTNRVMPHNASNVEDDMREVVRNVNALMVVASQEPDPMVRAQLYETIASDFDAVVDEALFDVETPEAPSRVAAREGETEGNAVSARHLSAPANQVRRTRGGSQVLPDAVVGEVTSIQALLHAIGDPNVPIERRAEIIDQVTDALPGGEGAIILTSMWRDWLDGSPVQGTGENTQFTQGALATYEQIEGLADGTFVYAQVGGVVQAVETVPVTITSPHRDNTVTNRPVNVPITSEVGESGSLSHVRTVVKIGGKNVVMWAETTPYMSSLAAWAANVTLYGPPDEETGVRPLVVAAGDFISGELLSSLGEPWLLEQQQAGRVSQSQVQIGTQITLPGGKVMVRDDLTGGWYNGKLPATENRHPFDDSLMIEPGGAAQLEWDKFAHAASVPLPYEGVSRKEMEGIVTTMIENDELDPEDFGARNSVGDYDPATLAELAGAYWSRNDAATNMATHAGAREGGGRGPRPGGHGTDWLGPNGALLAEERREWERGKARAQALFDEWQSVPPLSDTALQNTWENFTGGTTDAERSGLSAYAEKFGLKIGVGGQTETRASAVRRTGEVPTVPDFNAMQNRNSRITGEVPSPSNRLRVAPLRSELPQPNLSSGPRVNAPTRLAPRPPPPPPIRTEAPLPSAATAAPRRPPAPTPRAAKPYVPPTPRRTAPPKPRTPTTTRRTAGGGYAV